MTKLVRGASVFLLTGLLAACASGGDLPPPPANFTTVQPAPVIETNYAIGPLDKLSIDVFQVPELTMESVQVDAAGDISLPLIGTVSAAGKSANQLSSDIAERLNASYLQSPQVTVRVTETVSRRVTVEGAVTQPGVYPMNGPTTLLQAIAVARGPNNMADLRRVAIFRTIDGRRAAAVFDLAAIRKGEAPDPEIHGNDIVVVQSSAARGVWQDIMRTIPVLGVFRFF